MLTKAQRDMLSYVREFTEVHGYAPSFIEMMEALNLSSKSGVYRLLKALEERGHIRRLPSRARAIEVIDNPHLSSPLENVSNIDLANEANRRGLALVDVLWFEKAPLVARVRKG
jgi:SOS-response transcriptional repressor LexA